MRGRPPGPYLCDPAEMEVTTQEGWALAKIYCLYDPAENPAWCAEVETLGSLFAASPVLFELLKRVRDYFSNHPVLEPSQSLAALLHDIQTALTPLEGE